MATVKFDSERGVVNRAGADAEINPFDENALKAAVDLKHTYDDVEITAVTMGPPRSEKSLRMAFAKGADKMVLLTDREFGGSDTYATARILSAAIRHIGDYDLIICGEKSVDGDTAQVGAEVAEFLGLPHSYYVDSIKLEEDKVRVTVENISGRRQERVLTCPCLVSVKRKLLSLEQDVEILTIKDLEELTPDNTGFAGSPTKVSKVVVPGVITRESHIYREDTEAFAAKIEEVLSAKGLV